MRRTYTQIQMTTATEEELKVDGIGSNGINSTPRRSEESVETLACVIRIAAHVQYKNNCERPD